MIVRKLRLQRGWTQEQLAELAGLSVRSIQRIERGSALSLETINALAAVFEVDRSLFTPGETTVEPSTSPDRAEPATPLKADEAEAMEYVKGLKEFYTHLSMYVLFVLVFGSVFGFERPFIYLGAIGWGIGVLINGLAAFEVISLGGPKWERRMVEKRLGRRLQ